MGLISVSVKQGSASWLQWRRDNGIGASEVSAIIGTNDYQTIFDIFSIKVGLKQDKDWLNEQKHRGRIAEQEIANSWEFWDGKYNDHYVPGYVIGENKYMEALADAKSRGEKINRDDYVVRKCRKAKGILYNEKYPWLFISPDRIILPNQIKLTDGSVNKKFSHVEIKQMGFWNSRQYEDGIPPSHVSQVMSGQIVLDIEYAELALMADNKLRVIPYEWNQEYVDKILESTNAFWYGNVLPAREQYAKIQAAERGGESPRVIEELYAEFQQYEPEPTNEEGFADYVKKTRSVDIGNTLMGNDDLMEAAKTYQAFNACKNILDKAQLTYKNRIIDVMSREGVGEVHWKTGEWIRNKPDKNKSNATFRVSDKIYPVEKNVAEQLSTLNFDKMFEED